MSKRECLLTIAPLSVFVKDRDLVLDDYFFADRQQRWGRKREEGRGRDRVGAFARSLIHSLVAYGGMLHALTVHDEEQTLLEGLLCSCSLLSDADGFCFKNRCDCGVV